MALRVAVFAVRILTYSCFDLVVEKCAYGGGGLNNRTLCVEEGYSWARHGERWSAVEVWQLVQAVLSTTPLFLLLVPHGLTAILSAFTVAALAEARRGGVVLQSIKALDVLGHTTSLCVDKNSFLSSGVKALALAHICGVPWTDKAGAGEVSAACAACTARVPACLGAYLAEGAPRHLAQRSTFLSLESWRAAIPCAIPICAPAYGLPASVRQGDAALARRLWQPLDSS